MDLGLLVLGLAVAGCAAGLLYRGLARRGRARSLLMNSLKLFSPEFFLSQGEYSGLAVDRKSHKILLLKRDLGQEILTFPEILSVKLIEDQHVVTATRLRGQRGLSPEDLKRCLGDTSSHEAAGPLATAPDTPRARDLRLSLRVAKPAAPDREIVFFQRPNGLSRASQEYVRARTQAERWCVLLQVAIQQLDEEERR